MKEHEYGKAHDNFQRALRVNPDYLEARYNLALAYKAPQPDARRPRKSCAPCSSVKPDLADAWGQLGQIARRRGRRTRPPSTQLTKATRSDPKFAAAWLLARQRLYGGRQALRGEGRLHHLHRGRRQQCPVPQQHRVAEKKCALQDKALVDVKERRRRHQDTRGRVLGRASSSSDKGLVNDEERAYKRCLKYDAKYALCHFGLFEIYQEPQRREERHRRMQELPQVRQRVRVREPGRDLQAVRRRLTKRLDGRPTHRQAEERERRRRRGKDGACSTTSSSPSGAIRSCQVVLAQQAVSRNHARISRDGTLFFVEDLGSSFGTPSTAQKLPKGEKRLLRNGDVIAIAQFDVTFDRVAEQQRRRLGQDAASRPPGGQGRDEGPRRRRRERLLPGDERRDRGPAHRDSPTRRNTSSAATPPTPTSCSTTTSSSRKHVKVRRDWSGTHVEDLGSRNGIKLNKKRTRKATIKDRDELEIGGVRLLFVDPSEVREESRGDVLQRSDDDESTLAGSPRKRRPPSRSSLARKSPTGDQVPPPEEERAAEEAPGRRGPEDRRRSARRTKSPPRTRRSHRRTRPRTTRARQADRLQQQAAPDRARHRRRDGGHGRGA